MRACSLKVSTCCHALLQLQALPWPAFRVRVPPCLPAGLPAGRPLPHPRRILFLLLQALCLRLEAAPGRLSLA